MSHCHSDKKMSYYMRVKHTTHTKPANKYSIIIIFTRWTRKKKIIVFRNIKIWFGVILLLFRLIHIFIRDVHRVWVCSCLRVHFPRPFVSPDKWIQMSAQKPTHRNTRTSYTQVVIPFFAHFSLNYDANKHEIFYGYRFCFFCLLFMNTMALSQIISHNKMPPQISHVNSRHNRPIYIMLKIIAFTFNTLLAKMRFLYEFLLIFFFASSLLFTSFAIVVLCIRFF